MEISDSRQSWPSLARLGLDGRNVEYASSWCVGDRSRSMQLWFGLAVSPVSVKMRMSDTGLHSSGNYSVRSLSRCSWI